MSNELYLKQRYRKVIRRKSLKPNTTTKKKIQLVKKWSSGRILELGPGELPIFKNSLKIDIYPFKRKNYKVGDCNKHFPIKGREKYDTIVACEILEHIHNIDNFLRECRRFLVPNGKLIVSVPNVLYWRNRIGMLFGKTNWYDIAFKFGDLRCFHPKQIKELLQNYGFHVIDIESLQDKIKIVSLCEEFIVLAEKVNSGKIFTFSEDKFWGVINHDLETLHIKLV